MPELCNLSENLLEEGRVKGRQEAIAEGELKVLKAQVAILKNLMESMNCMAEKAMDLMGISKEDRPELLKALHS